VLVLACVGLGVAKEGSILHNFLVSLQTTYSNNVYTVNGCNWLLAFSVYGWLGLCCENKQQHNSVRRLTFSFVAGSLFGWIFFALRKKNWERSTTGISWPRLYTHAYLCKITHKKIQDLLQLLRTGPAIRLCSGAPIFHRLFFQWTHKPPSFVHVLKPK